MFYPVFIDIRHRHILVVGGGTVAERKVESLLEAGALVTVVSPESTGPLHELSRSGRITLHQRRFVPSDVDGVMLVISATNDDVAQAQVCDAARPKSIMVNTVDKPDFCDFIIPAIVRRGDVTLAISTSGKSPSLAGAVRARLEGVLTEEVERTARVLGEVRREVHERFSDADERKRVFDAILKSGIMEWIGDCDDDTALQRVRAMIAGCQ